MIDAPVATSNKSRAFIFRDRIAKPRRRTELGLLLLAWAIIIFAYILSFWGISFSLPTHIELYLGIVIGATFIAHLANRVLAPGADSVILPMVTLLNGLGWVMVASLDATPTVSRLYGSHLASHQAIWTSLGVILYVGTLIVVRQVQRLELYRYILGLTGLALLFSPLIPGLGAPVGSVRLWIHLGPLSFEPVEIGKLCLAIFFASFLVEKRELLSTFTFRIRNRLYPDPRSFGPVLMIAGVSILLIGAEHDIGFALLIFMLFVSMLWLVTGRFTYLIIGAISFVVATILGELLFPQAGQRITIWLHAFRYANTTGYQLVQAQYALAAGKIAGTGLGLGHLGNVPLIASDMIFAAFGNELGLVGTTMLVMAFLLLSAAGFRIALNHKAEFPKVLAAALTFILALQAFIVIAGITRILPLTGITLPFVAYGGSSLIGNYILVALLMRLSTEAEGHQPLRSRFRQKKYK